MAQEPSKLKEEIRSVIEREINQAGSEGISTEDLFAKAVKGRENEIGRVRGFFSSLTRSLGLVKWKGRWYLRDYAPPEALTPSVKAEEKPRRGKPRKEEALEERVQEYDHISYIQLIDSAGAKFTLEFIHAKVVILLKL